MKTNWGLLESPPRSVQSPLRAPTRPERFVGIDVGADTLKLVELRREDGEWVQGRRACVEHGKKPGPVLQALLRDWDWPTVRAAAVSGRLGRQINLPQIPTKQAQLRGYRFLFGDEPATVVSVGSHGFSVLELRASGQTVWRENSRCSQGTGNFLRQLVERFSLTVEEASFLCANVIDPAPLSGRCPVILKTDMTHLANKGENRARILAGLFDAVCENVLVLIKPGTSPSRVLLIGGVSRSPRVRKVFAEALARNGLRLETLDEEAALGLEALGSAWVAAGSPGRLPPLEKLFRPPPEVRLERLPALKDWLPRVRRMPARPWANIADSRRPIVLGFDIGSTGSKAVALDAETRETLWEAYRQTLGDPVGAAQALLRQYVAGPLSSQPPRAFGVTGSGREIAGSLLISCYGKDAVFVLNEIVAHATGALQADPRVDTIFEIGGQDAKYIRLAEGRIIDCAMNEACSAGTGSFIEEQGRKFSGIDDVRQLGRAALEAPFGVSLGQHCSVFMAEVIDEAVAGGVESSVIIAGLYDSIVQNYLHRVKGNRSVGQVIFCQGMPFAADALAAAVARQTGSEVIVPPNPGTVGALGIALLASRELKTAALAAVDPALFLGARVEQKDTFVCRATRGCGGAGNRCRIDRLCTWVHEERHQFTWGGSCSLHDKGTRRQKLPDLAPDPFREREESLKQLTEPFLALRGRPRVALSDEFMLKGLFPFFAAFLHESGFDLLAVNDSGPADLKRGVQVANVPFCAPLQLFHGLVERMSGLGADYLFLPLLRSVPRVAGQQNSVTCPIVQASPDIVRWDCGQGEHDACGASQPRCACADLGAEPLLEASASLPTPARSSKARQPRILSPILDVGEGNLESASFRAGCAALAKELGVPDRRWRAAFKAASAAQQRFDAACLEVGRRALVFCAERRVTPVVVLGRAYTIYNKVLNSNVPALLREQGAVGIPVDCYPVADDVPVFDDMYWGYGQQNLRAAHQVRRSPGEYALYCSNYSCGPDSFNLHFAAHIMEGKPFTIIETDGHAGDAGTKTRVEAFLHCVEEDRARGRSEQTPNDFRQLRVRPLRLRDLQGGDARERVLIPHMGPNSDVAAAVFRGLGLRAESLPPPDAGTLRLGRRHTSGKECLPMALTLGSLLQRLQGVEDAAERFVYLMPGTQGPCRFGVYNLLNQIVLKRLGWSERVRVWSPDSAAYFEGFPAGTAGLMFTGFMANDLLLQAMLDCRPVETAAGAAEQLYQHFQLRLLETLEQTGRAGLPLGGSLWQMVSGKLFGVAALLREAGAAFAAVRGSKPLPRVLLVGEIYVRSTDFSNDHVARKLEARGLRVRLAPANEWIEYCDYVAQQEAKRAGLSQRLTSTLQRRIQEKTYALMAERLGWPPHARVPDALAAARPYLRPSVQGEAILSLGFPLHEWRHGEIDAVVNVGPLECMPSKIAEAQFHHLAEREGLPSLTLSYNGDPLSPEVLDNFAFEVRARFDQKARGRGRSPISTRAKKAPRPAVARMGQ
jgi:activator of 2-hydroxyglutaryl-CoA dehydratase/predicted nucleotide-binding protein (sugar kinase/HSP70/actin superfamily)